VIADTTHAAARITAIAQHAQQHAAATRDRTSPHWVWLEEAGDHGPETRLYRQYPLQGLRVLQDDVTLFTRAAS
jgi:hypothetical protein